MFWVHVRFHTPLTPKTLFRSLWLNRQVLDTDFPPNKKMGSPQLKLYFLAIWLSVSEHHAWHLRCRPHLQRLDASKCKSLQSDDALKQLSAVLRGGFATHGHLIYVEWLGMTHFGEECSMWILHHLDFHVAVLGGIQCEPWVLDVLGGASTFVMVDIGRQTSGMGPKVRPFLRPGEGLQHLYLGKATGGWRAFFPLEM